MSVSKPSLKVEVPNSKIPNSVRKIPNSNLHRMVVAHVVVAVDVVLAIVRRLSAVSVSGSNLFPKLRIRN